VTDPRRRRLALIRLGDIQRNRGNLEGAQKIYAQAEDNSRYGPKASVSVTEGKHIHDFEAFMREGKGDRALKSIEEWIWRCPTKRSDGHVFEMRVQANLLKGDYQEARKQAEIYLKFGESPDYVPRLHALAGEACLELGRVEAARKHWETVLRDWKESPAVEKAENGLYRLERGG
jgi:tetratricopeptide (TPR) repeat protein